MPSSVHECYGFPVNCHFDPAAGRVVDRFFGPVPATPSDRTTVTVRITVAETTGAAPVPPPYFPPGWETDDEIVIAVGDSAAVVAPGRFEVRITLAPADVDDSIVWGRWLLEKAFLLLTLRSPHHYGLHAGALTLDGRSALCTADSGVGKSTFSAWALRRGATFAGDDAMMRHLDDASGAFFGYPLAAYLSPALVTDWPQLAEARSDAVPGRDKLRVQWPPAMRGSLRPRAEPHAMLFLTRDHHDIRPVAVAEAVNRCWEDVAVGKPERVLAAVRADLTERFTAIPVVEFGLGPDLDTNFDRLAALLATG